MTRPLSSESRTLAVSGNPDTIPADMSATLERVVTQFAGLIHQTARRHGLSIEEQDSAVQEVRIRLWKALESGENIRQAPASYIYRTALSAVIDYIRRRGARREEDLDEGRAPPSVRPGEQADAVVRASDIEQAIERALGSLPETRRAVVRLHLSGYDRFEIADLMGWSEPKTRNLLYRGLETMRAELTRMGFAPGDSV